MRLAMVSVVATACLAVAIGGGERESPQRHVEAGAGVAIDHVRREGHPCRPEPLVDPYTVPPGAVRFVVDVCVIRSPARTRYVERPRSVRPESELG